MTSSRIVELSTCPEHVDRLASWHHAEWGLLYGESWTDDDARRELREQAERRVWSNTLVALDGESLLGSVSVVSEDAAALSHYGSPWLASLFVAPEFRGRGVGSRLASAGINWAARHGVARLLLFTAGQSAYYQRMGWRLIARDALNGYGVDVFDLHPRDVELR